SGGDAGFRAGGDPNTRIGSGVRRYGRTCILGGATVHDDDLERGVGLCTHCLQTLVQPRFIAADREDNTDHTTTTPGAPCVFLAQRDTQRQRYGVSVPPAQTLPSYAQPHANTLVQSNDSETSY